jgi:hypothetical protein
VFYFQQLLNNALAGIDGTAIIPTVTNFAFAILVLLMVPGNPASGAIYIYDRVGQQFYLVSFDQGSDDTLTIPEFEDLLGEYRLLDCVSNPSQFRASLQEPARA